MQVLPTDEHIPGILDTVRRRRACVVVAPPGADKTTRVPPALLAHGPLILLVASSPCVLRPTRCSATSARSCSTSSTSAACTPTWRARRSARDSLRLVVMSAPLDTGAVAVFLDDCRGIEVPGRCTR